MTRALRYSPSAAARLPRVRENNPQVVVTAGQVLAELGGVGEVGDEFLLERESRAILACGLLSLSETGEHDPQVVVVPGGLLTV